MDTEKEKREERTRRECEQGRIVKTCNKNDVQFGQEEDRATNYIEINRNKQTDKDKN